MTPRSLLLLLVAALVVFLAADRVGLGGAEPASETAPSRTPRTVAASPKPVSEAVGPTRDSASPRLTLPPIPAGVTDLKCSELFKPVGPKGLEYTDKAKRLDGKKVRLLGYMAKQEQPQPGKLLLTPVPVRLQEDEMGFADDLPASVVHVFTAVETNRVVPFTPGLLLLTGTLSTGSREESDGRVSAVRLLLDPPPASNARTTDTNSATTAPTAQTAP